MRKVKQRRLPEVVEADRGVRQLLGFWHQFVQEVMELPLSVTDGPAVNLWAAQLVPDKTNKKRGEHDQLVTRNMYFSTFLRRVNADIYILCKKSAFVPKNVDNTVFFILDILFYTSNIVFKSALVSRFRSSGPSLFQCLTQLVENI